MCNLFQYPFQEVDRFHDLEEQLSTQGYTGIWKVVMLILHWFFIKFCLGTTLKASALTLLNVDLFCLVCNSALLEVYFLFLVSWFILELILGTLLIHNVGGIHCQNLTLIKKANESVCLDAWEYP